MRAAVVGGQAVIEGVMYRKGKRLTIAVRHPKKGILLKKKRIKSISDNRAWLRWPLLRGVIALFETMIIGTKALFISANLSTSAKEEKLTTKEIVWSLIVSLFFALLIFKVIPLISAQVLQNTSSVGWLGFPVIEGIIKFAVLVIYLVIIARMDDVKTLFQYHGAEHKAINCYEAGKKITKKNVLACPTFHPRCGTSFIVFVLLLSILFYLFIPVTLPFLGKLLSRLLLLPVIAAVAYEIIRLSGKHAEHGFFKFLSYPGRWVQKLTTREPTPKQVDVAIASLKAVL